MPPLAAPAAPPSFAVLLLAWDEAAPAVRAIIEAVQAPASILAGTLVIVPAGAEAAPAAAEMQAPVVAEVLPIAQPPVAPPVMAATGQAAATSLPSIPASAPTLPPSPALVGEPGSGAPALPPAHRLPAQVWSAVRVLRLGSFSLPELAAQAGQPLPAPVWAGAATVPAAPYQGAAAGPVSSPAETSPAFNLAHTIIPAATSQPLQAPAPAATSASEVVPARASGLRTGAAGTGAVVPGHLPIASFFLSPAEEPDAPLDFDFPATSPVMPDLEATATSEADALTESATWAEALAALQKPATVPPVATSLAAPALLPSHAVLAPAALPNAPDLNFQIIQYARFAVPLALAEQPFGVLYAPSWPTWLAAQELRQRTGRPLVLHLTELAAGPEPADTATGWVAELQRQALRRADLVLTETHTLASRLRRELGLPAHAVRVVPAANTAGVARALRRAQVG